MQFLSQLKIHSIHKKISVQNLSNYLNQPHTKILTKLLKWSALLFFIFFCNRFNLFCFRVKSNPNQKPRILGFDDTYVIVDWNENFKSKLIQILEVRTGDSKYELQLDTELKDIREAKICCGRMAVLGFSVRSKKLDVIVVDLKTKNILLRCSAAANIIGSDFFILQKNRILFLEVTADPNLPRSKFIYSAGFSF